MTQPTALGVGSYTATVVDEPVRGGPPDAYVYSLPGIDQVRAWLRGLAPRSPLSHLIGYRLTQAGSGSATVTLPASPWLQNSDGTVDVIMVAETAMAFAVLTGAPAGGEVRTAALSFGYLRPCTLESETLVARARTINSGPTFTNAEVLVEDALGRGVMHATGSMLIRPIEPPPPPAAGELKPVGVTSYATPDPPARPLPKDLVPSVWPDTDGLSLARKNASGELAAPLNRLLGIEIVEIEEGVGSLAFRTSEWLCSGYREVAAGVIACVLHVALNGAIVTVSPPGYRGGIIAESVSFLRPVFPNGRELVVRGLVTHRAGNTVIAVAEAIDADGNVLTVGQETALLRPRRKRAPTGAEPERMLATVLFTDIVASTERAGELGDAGWHELLEEHHRVVRKQLQIFKGREVKTTGDGFLTTFDSPGRAMQCARAIRDGVRRLGLEIRAGLHTGECEVSGADVSGIAVHLASRVQDLATPGEILVSSTVHDLVTGSGLPFVDRGHHQLKGIDGDWRLFALEG